MLTLWISAAFARPPDPFASCEEQSAYYATQLRPDPNSRPVLWWLQKDAPCELDQKLQGTPPPSGHQVSCVDDHGHLYGPQSRFAPDGKVVLQTAYIHDREAGPRLEWDPATYELVREVHFRSGKQDGETVEWLPDAGVVVTSYTRGVRSGPTWRLDDRGQVLLVENWRSEARHGRSCAWRDGTWVQQVWLDGEPAAMD